MATRNTGLDYILGGGPIIEFSGHHLPTTRDVLRFYSQYWKINQSDSVKEKAVALKLQQFYESRNMNAMSTFGIISKVRREVSVLKKVLKLKTKEKTDLNIQFERTYIDNLNRTFNVSEILTSPVERNSISPMEIDSEDDFFGMFRLKAKSKKCKK